MKKNVSILCITSLAATLLYPFSSLNASEPSDPPVVESTSDLTPITFASLTSAPQIETTVPPTVEDPPQVIISTPREPEPAPPVAESRRHREPAHDPAPAPSKQEPQSAPAPTKQTPAPAAAPQAPMVYQQQTFTSYYMTDANGVTWTSADPQCLSQFVGQRNARSSCGASSRSQFRLRLFHR